MKYASITAFLLLGILTSVPIFVAAASCQDDTLLLHRIFHYRQAMVQDIGELERNVYMKFHYDIDKRNPALWVIPTMYPLAKGNRHFLMETYNRLKFKSINQYESRQQLIWGTIPRYRKAMSPILEFLTPNLYAPTIYQSHTLSPFNANNRKLYRYKIISQQGGHAIVSFRPRYRRNTQLISGIAYVDSLTGRIIHAILLGEYDGINFHTEAIMGEEGVQSLLPDLCYTQAKFNFVGNRVRVGFEAAYNCPTTLPDTLENEHNRHLLEQLRPLPLSESERQVYKEYDSLHHVKPDTIDTLQTPRKKKNALINVLDAIGQNLVTSIKARSENASLRIYPLLSPQYLSYSRRYGLAYKIRMKSNYHFNAHRYFDFNPQLGYNFKFKKLYFTLPLRFNYNPKRDGYVELVYGNGNRTRHSSVIYEIERQYGDTIDTSGKNLDMFNDNYIRLTNNIMLFDWIDIESGVSLHRRTAYNAREMKRLGQPTEYRSLAPVLSVKLRPWRKGPLFTIDYQRGLKGINKSSIDYERWEFDSSLKYQSASLRTLNVRLGTGFYSRKQGSYFVDFENFRDNNLPEGWDDEWTGNFQLLNSRWYNESRYYARANLSYESPLLLMSWIPFVGRHLERERFYLSGLSIDHTRPYFELGYGFTTRFFSIGVFSSFLRQHFQEIECKFTFELFRRW